MSVVTFEQRVAACERLKENDRIWFPRLLRRYAMAQRGRDSPLPAQWQHNGDRGCALQVVA